MNFYPLPKKPSKIKRSMFNQLNVRLTIFCLTVFLLLTYLISINNTATKGIEISQMQNEIKKLNEQQRFLEIQAGELKSLNRIEQISNNDLSMVVADNYQYLMPKNNEMVVVKN